MYRKLRSVLPEKMVSTIEQLNNLIYRKYGVNFNLARIELNKNYIIVNSSSRI